MELVNRTPFAADRLLHVDSDARERLVVVLKGTWTLGEDGQLHADEQPAPPQPQDDFHGEPDASSILAEAELGPTKPASEVLITGHALARKPGTRAMDVRFTVGRLRKTIRVFGERRWSKRLGRLGLSDPEVFDRVPLMWEQAFGGTDGTPKEKNQGAELRNPVGRGFAAKGSKLEFDGQLAPALEDPKDLLSKPAAKGSPVNFGPICRHWAPRRDYAGTYDEKWMAESFPLLPKDFDPRFHHAAPPDQIARGYFRGGEPVELIGLTPEGRTQFALPDATPQLTVKFRRRSEELPFVLETAGFDSDAGRLRVLWKAELDVHGEFLDILRMECRPEVNGG